MLTMLQFDKLDIQYLFQVNMPLVYVYLKVVLTIGTMQKSVLEVFGM